MNQHGNITRSVREQDVQRDWLVVDATNCTVGRLATQIATLLRGKHKPLFTPHVDCGDFVIVINADKVVLEGKRAEQKEYFHNTGYPGGGRMRSFSNIMKSKPEEIVELAVKGMLPKNSLGRAIVKKLKVYSGSEHPHSAQQPKNYELPYLHLGTK
jgi:large subunit ribosomal protein L13